MNEWIIIVMQAMKRNTRNTTISAANNDAFEVDEVS